MRQLLTFIAMVSLMISTRTSGGNLGLFEAAGDVGEVGRVGSVLNPEKINDETPEYIKKLKEASDSSMLHFELYESRPEFSKRYLGGNWFGSEKPRGLLDPTRRLVALSKESDR